ncbi:MAG: hypothetical protein AB8B93_06795 [Pseudomonadales bacterium]
MADHDMAWIVVAGAGLLALGFWFLITRGIANSLLRSWLRCVAAILMLLPAPVPGYHGQFAPAYIVALFEAVFQDAGQPEQAFIILGGGVLAVSVLLLVWGLVRPRRAATASAPTAAREPAKRVAPTAP